MPAGTPTTEAAEKAVITQPIAEARRASGMTSPTTASTSAPRVPPNRPVAKRSASKL